MTDGGIVVNNILYNIINSFDSVSLMDSWIMKTMHKNTAIILKRILVLYSRTINDNYLVIL